MTTTRTAVLAALLAGATCAATAEISTSTLLTSHVAPKVGAVADNYAKGVHASYSNALTESHKLRAAITAFLDAPSTPALQSAKDAWLTAHKVYSLTEVYRFYDGPIDAPETGPEPMLNAWPMDEAYVDYVKGNASAGIINMPAEFSAINEELLVSLNENGGEKNISTGFHAIEFLLWGQDLSTTGPGDRPVSDYIPAENPSAVRRAQYLKLVTALVLKHLKQVELAWAPTTGSYAAEFTKLDPHEQVRRILTGIAMMAGDELSQERLVVPMETRDQEDEQSCFSDTTLSSLKQDLEGIRQVYTGKFSTVSGPGISALVSAEDGSLDADIRSKIDEISKAFEAVPLPFDQALQSDAGRTKIEAVVTGLEDLADLLVKAATMLNVTLNLT